MSTGQQIIKILAIIFAIVIIVNIFGWIIFGISTLVGVDLLTTTTKEETIDYTETYQQNIKRLEVETTISQLTIQAGEQWKVEGTNLPKQFSAKISGSTLKVKEEGSKSLFQDNTQAKIVITVPTQVTLNQIDLDINLGSNKIENITVDKLELNGGIGNIDINNLTVQNEIEIDGAAGKLTIKNSQLRNLDLDIGIGELEMSAEILGNSKIDSGAGNIQLELMGEKDQYTITTKTGIGNMTLNEQKCLNNHIYGRGQNNITISGGVGNVKIKTQENSNTNQA